MLDPLKERSHHKCNGCSITSQNEKFSLGFQIDTLPQAEGEKAREKSEE